MSTQVLPSPGRGRGLFATRDFKPKSFVIQYTGEVIKESKKRKRYPDNDALYLVQCKRRLYIDARDETTSSAARFINRANKDEKNNCTIKISFCDGVPIVNIRTTRYVPKGAEFLVPYGRGYTTKQPQQSSNSPRPNEK